MKAMIWVLLYGGLFFANSLNAKDSKKNAASNVLIEDTLIFMIKDQVFSLTDLERVQKAMSEFDCMYPGAFVPEYFDLIVRKFDKRTLNKDYLKKYENTEKTKVYLNEFLKFLKIALYSREQSVSVTSELKKAMYLSAKTRNCSLDNFEGDTLSEALEMALMVEVFYRSRNVLDSQRELSKSERKNILKSLNSLSRSITNQITHTQFEISRNLKNDVQKKSEATTKKQESTDKE